MFRTVGGVVSGFQRISGQRVHVDLSDGHRAHHLDPDRRGLAGRLGGVRAGARVSPAIAETGHARVRRRGRRGLDEFPVRLDAHLFAFLDVDADGEDGDGFSHDERQGTKVERPAVVVVALLVFVALVTGVAGVTGDVNNDADDVAQTCYIVEKLSLNK